MVTRAERRFAEWFEGVRWLGSHMPGTWLDNSGRVTDREPEWSDESLDRIDSYTLLATYTNEPEILVSCLYRE